MADGFGEAGAGGFEADLGAEAALRSLRARIAVQAAAQPHVGLQTRRRLLPFRDIPSSFDSTERLLAALLDFERTLVEHRPSAEVEKARHACLARLDALIDVAFPPATPD